MALKRAVVGVKEKIQFSCLTSETVEGSALSLQGIDDIHGGDGLPLGMLSVGDGITDNVLKENFQDTTGFFIDEAGDTFDTTSAGKTTDSRLGDTLDVITKYFTMTLSASFSQTFSSLSTSRHVDYSRNLTKILIEADIKTVYILEQTLTDADVAESIPRERS